jgi:hydroxymethylbilane synthase
VTSGGQPIRIGTRGSALALAQASLVARALAAEGRPHRVVVVETEGDRRAADTAWGEGAFVKALESALLADRVDIAVHSAKDVPTDEDPRLRIAAYLPRADARDALVVRREVVAGGLGDLPPGAVVGTDSPRRSAFIRAARPDLVVRPLHGNVDTRLRRLDEGEADALVLAVAGLARLGREDRITAVLEPDVVPPAPGQGAIAVQIRVDDAPLIALAASIDDARTRAAVEAERAFLHASGGGCRSPIGAFATVSGGSLRLVAGVADDRGRIAREVVDAPLSEAPFAVTELARRLTAAIGGRAERAPRDSAQSPDGELPVAIVTRPRDEAAPLVGELARLRIRAAVVPTIEIRPVDPTLALDRELRALAEDDWIVVTSPNGARALTAHLRRAGVALPSARLAAVGAATAAALRGITSGGVWLPTGPDADSLARELPLHDDGRWRRVGVVRGRLAGDRLATALAARGAAVHEVVVYETREAPPASAALLLDALGQAPAATILASPSAARGLVALGGDRRADLLAIPAICIGPVTADAARALGYRVAAVAARPEAAVVAEAVASVVAPSRVRGEAAVPG